MAKPKIRFKGYTDDWEQRKLGDLVDRVTRKNQDLVSELPLTISAQYGLMDQNEFFDKRVASKDVSGYYLIENGEFAYNKSTSTDAPWGAVKRLDRYENGVLSTLYIVFGIKENNPVDSDFLVSYYSTNLWHKGIHEIAAEGARNHGLLNIAPADFFETDLTIPQDIEEQKKIGKYFEDLERLITLHQCKCHLLLKLLHNDWEQRKFGDLVEKYEDPIDTPTDGYMRLGIRSHAKGTFHSYVEKGKELETAKMFRVAANNFIVNITFGWEHAVAITDESDAGKLVSHRFPQYSFENGMIPMFFKYLILDENFKHHLELSSPGGAGRNRVLKLNDMLEYKMKFPCEDEQRKLASYFDDLDHLITLHQRKCEETKKLKKYMLQKMFPQNGQTVPEIRFAGFTDAWEQRKLPEFVSFFNGLTYMPDDVQETGTLVLRSSNVKNGEVVDADNVYVSDKVVTSENVQEGDIIVVIRNGSRALIGKHAQIKASMPNTVIGAFMSGIRSEHSSFINALLDTSAFENEIAKNMGATINQITGYMFSKMEFMIPSEEEQQKIGEYFSNLDNLITLHQHKCEQLQSMKKFMLQKMFV